jgi:hypothetical protein
VVTLATRPPAGTSLSVAARTRGLDFELTPEARGDLRRRGVGEEQLSDLDRIAADPDPFGDTPRKANRPLIVLGAVAIAGVLTGIGFLVAELIDEDDKTVIIHDGHTYVRVDD